MVVFIDEEVVDVEAVKGAVVVVSHMIEVIIEGLGKREVLLVKLLKICPKGVSSVEPSAERRLRYARSERRLLKAKVDSEVAVQGRCSSG